MHNAETVVFIIIIFAEPIMFCKTNITKYKQS